jgi:hypothetical protein
MQRKIKVMQLYRLIKKIKKAGDKPRPVDNLLSTVTEDNY